MSETAQYMSALDRDAPRLLLEWREPDARRRHAVAGAAAVCIHALFIALAWWFPAAPPAGAPDLVFNPRRSTPLVAPPAPFRLTQKEPQRGQPAAEVDLAALLPRPALRQPLQAPPPRPFVPPPGSPAAGARRAPELEAPRIELTQALPPIPSPTPAERLPTVPPPESPAARNPFERVGGPPSSTAAAPAAAARPHIEDVVKSVVRGGGSGLVVGDSQSQAGTASEAVLQNPRQGRSASSLELLSDARGTDFRPYLIQVLSAVRRNWQAVIPESARFGQRGRVAIQFIIDRYGQVPKLVIAVPSGTDALDRAAVAGISASNPFPPLPGDFRGNQIRLQLVFSYNMPR